MQKALHYLKIKVSRVEEDKQRVTQSWQSKMLKKQEEVERVAKEKKVLEKEMRSLQEEKLKIQKDLDDAKI